MTRLFFLLAVVFAAPLATVIQPLPRDSMAYPTKEAPCGGVPRGKSHLLSQPGSLNPLSWKVITPSNGRCKVELIFGVEYNDPHSLFPLDESADSNGYFPCGDEPGLYKKVFQFPQDSCDSCTLLWIWENQVETVFQCIDVEITQNADSACYGKCQNLGFCSDGLCVCETGFFGTFCELDGRGETVNLIGLFVGLVILLVVFLYLFTAYKRISKGESLYTERLIFRKLCFWLPVFGDLGK